MPRETSTDITELRQVAEHASRLAARVRTVHARLRRAADEPTRRAGYRLDIAEGAIEQAAGEIRRTAEDVARIKNRGTCAADWGLCPEHGNTLTSSGGRSWCHRAGCRHRWDYDRGGLPCTEPAAYQVRDASGGTSQLCTGHANDARSTLIGAQFTRINH